MHSDPRSPLAAPAVHAACAAHQRDEHTVVPGRAQPFQTLPPGGGMGKPGFPIPLRGGGVGKPGFPTPLLQRPMFTSALHAVPPHNAAMNIRLFLGGLRPPKPSRGWGNGETRFPHTPLREPIFTLGEGDTRSNPPTARSVRNGLFLWYQHTTRYRPRKDPGIGKCQCLEA